MKVVLDSMAFVWSATDPSRVPDSVRQTLTAAAARLISIASVWEMAIKVGLGKLSFGAPLAEVFREQMDALDLTLLPITLEHALAVHELPGHHRDPFDRMPIAQARHEGLTIVTNDAQIARYDVPIAW